MLHVFCASSQFQFDRMNMNVAYFAYHSNKRNICFVERMSVFICFCTQQVQYMYVTPADTRLTTGLLSHQDNRACRPDLEPVMNERM
jgi:hypothetical protein